MNYLDILSDIYDEIILDMDDCIMSLSDEDYRELTNKVIAKYNLHICQVLPLAYLAHYRPSFIVEEKLVRVSPVEDYTVRGLDDLVKRKFILRKRVSDGRMSYAIHPEAVLAMSAGNKYGLVRIDCIDEIRKASLKEILDNDWINTFHDKMENNSDTSMLDAVQELKIQDLSIGCQKAFWVLARQFVNRFSSPFEFWNDRDALFECSYDENTLKTDIGELVMFGLATSIPLEQYVNEHLTEQFALSVKAVKTLFNGHCELVNYSEISKSADVILAKDIAPKEMFYSKETQEEIDHLKYMLSPEKFEKVQQTLVNRKRNPAVISLLWGPPGTGKTEAVKQISRESGRDIILLDAAKTTMGLVGASEKIFRSLFLSYSYIVAVSKLAPILLMNEADQFLSSRMKNVSSSYARSENVISDIILQAFEDMSGILLATTNLKDNLDVAFERRFLFKTEITNPDADARKKIWKVSIPELSDEEAARLASDFEMSGGQISNVAAKRDLASLYMEDDLGYDYIAKLCAAETGAGSHRTVNRIGF